MLCGKNSLKCSHLDHVFDALQFLNMPGHQIFLAKHDDVPISRTHGVSSVAAWTTMQERYRSVGYLRTTMPFISAAKHKAANPKDYLYGLLGVLKEEIRLQIPVDYNSTD